MFDLRYHVASLAAVFLALIIGILVGVGISSGGFVSKSERSLLNSRIAELQSRLDAATAQAGELAQAQQAAQTFIKDAYPALMTGRLAGKQIAVIFVGAIDDRLRSLVEKTLTDAGGASPLRVRALKVPIDVTAVDAALGRRPALASYVGDKKLPDLGQRLGQEFVLGGKTPLWQTLSTQLVEERSGTDKPPADAVVVVRSANPQAGQTARFLAGFYRGLTSSALPAVGVETSTVEFSAVPVFDQAKLSTVDDLETQPGRLALALLLAGAASGDYGLKPSAHNGVLPPIEPLPFPARPGG
jgi:MFS superfamily sulfate permease-like transporter